MPICIILECNAECSTVQEEAYTELLILHILQNVSSAVITEYGSRERRNVSSAVVITE